MPRLLFAAALWLAIGAPVHAQQDAAPFDPLRFELSYAAAEDAEARITLLGEAVSTLERDPNADLRVYFDLNLLYLEELEASGALAQAAQLATQLAEFALTRGATLDLEPMAHLATAIRLARASDNPAMTLALKDRELTYRRDGGQTGAQLADVLDEMSVLAETLGDTTRSAQLAEAARAARDAPTEKRTRSANDEGGFTEVEVFYATDRARTGRTNPSEFYGGGRGDLEYGTVAVTIPKVHVPGAIEAPSIWRLEFAPNPAKHVMLQKVTPADQAAFYDQMQARMADRDRKEAFVFVHGFNVRFDAAAKRAAQLAYDMNYRGVPVLYSWPSAGKTVNYVADTAVVRLSGRRLAVFLDELHQRSGADTIHIVAHSMGNRALTDALELLAVQNGGPALEKPLFGQVFFAAPDVDADLFAEMTKTIRPLVERMTLYASAQDWALVTSKSLHGNAPRAGQAGDTILKEQHFDTVDMSGLGDDMLAHSYFANDSSALVDIMSLLWRNPEPAARCGLAPIGGLDGDGAQAWRYQTGACDGPLFMGLLASAWQHAEVSLADLRALIAEHVSDAAKAAELEAQFVGMLGTD